MWKHACVRWEELFADLERQVEAELADELDAEVADLAVAEDSQVELADRVRARLGTSVVLGARGGERVAGELLDAGSTWFLLGQGRRRVVVPLHAVEWVEALAHAAPEQGRAARRLDLGHVLRALAELEGDVAVTTLGRVVVGELTKVGRDHVDVVERPGRSRVTIPFHAITSVAER